MQDNDFRFGCGFIKFSKIFKVLQRPCRRYTHHGIGHDQRVGTTVQVIVKLGSFPSRAEIFLNHDVDKPMFLRLIYRFSIRTRGLGVGH